MSLRVLRLCSAFEPPAAVLAGRGARLDPVGGMQNHVASLSRGLDRLGVRQTVLTSRPPGAPTLARLGERSRVLRVGLPIKRSRGLLPLAAAALAPALAARADLVHVHLTSDLGIVPVALAAARLHRLPLVVTVHCSLRHTLALDSPEARRVQRRGAPIERWATARAAAVITLTARLRDALAGDGIDPRRLHVIPSGVWRERFAGPFADPLPDLDGPRIVFVGRVEGEKGVATAVRALARLRTPGARLVVVGGGSEVEPVRRLARELGVGERVTVTGYVPHEQVPAHLAHADAQVMPSRFEELGTAMLEGLHSGLPVVASATGGIAETIDDGVSGLLAAPEDDAAFAAALDRVLTDRALAARLSSAARERARAFDWQALSGRVLDVYEGMRAPARS